MMRLFIFLLFTNISVFAQQETPKDSLVYLDEVIVKGLQKQKLTDKAPANASVEKYLEKAQNVNLIRRGVYAWEPVLNNMLSERSVITIDGMRVFGACTDKMDPVTSYVEVNNLSDIEIHSGQGGSMHGATIGGSIDLKRKKTIFAREQKWKGSMQTGVESNNLQRIWLGNLDFSAKKFVADASISYRKADNYKDGNQNVVKYSQFEKFNTAFNLGWKIHPRGVLRADAIFDQARDIGYPALPMDVSLAEAIMGSVSYKHIFENSAISDWDTKLYFNNIRHYMDDSLREEADKLPTKMDMPGKSQTFGTSSKLRLGHCDFVTDIQLNAYQNLSTAEMVMYYTTGGGTMFTYTWPEVATRYGGLSISNKWNIDNQIISFGGSAGFHNNYVQSDMGYNLNQVFHQFERSKTRFLANLFANYAIQTEKILVSGGIGYGNRAPSVSEAYGFYLFNSSDGFDYIGNPNLPNENSYEVNFSAKYSTESLILEAKSNFFHIQNYIFGVKFGEPSWQMTPLAQRRGVKMYEALKYANQLNTSLSADWTIFDFLHWKNSIGYAYGEDFEGKTLPFIRPLHYASSVLFHRNNFRTELVLTGDTRQTKFSSAYGEDETPAYILLHLRIGYQIVAPKIDFEFGIENIFDSYYSTYANWKNFPQMGRNITLSVRYSF